MVSYCSFCGSRLEPNMVFCSNCGADLKNIGIQTSDSNQELKSTKIMPSNSPLFDSNNSVIFIDWGYRNNINAGIFDNSGRKIGEITRGLSDYGIDYAVVDSETQESISLRHVDATHIAILQNKSQKLGEIERRLVKETLEVRPTPETSDYFTELEDFKVKKTIYNNSEEYQIAELLRPKPEEIPAQFKPANPYLLKIKHTGLHTRRLFALIVSILILYRSNPYH